MRILLGLVIAVSVAAGAAQEYSPHLDNGPMAERTQFPFHVKVKPTGLNVNFAGILISTEWVLTCAACANKAATYELGLGYFNMSNAQEVGRIDVPSVNITIHPDFDPSKFNQKNIALIKIAPITTSAYVDVIRLPPNGTTDLYTGWIGRVTGFGTGPEGSAQVLRYADMIVEEDSVCQGIGEPGQMCTTPISPGIGPCEDEGAGLTIVPDGTATAIAIFSYGFGSGPCPGPSALFTRTATYLQWINEVTGLTW